MYRKIKQFKRIVSVILVLFIALSIFVVALAVFDNTKKGNTNKVDAAFNLKGSLSDSVYSSTQEFEIEDFTGLNNFSKLVRGGKDFLGKKVFLKKSFSCNNSALEPIGHYSYRYV